MPDKVDLKKSIPSYSAKKGSFDFVTVPAFNYLMIDGFGDPNGDDYAAAVESIYAAAYALKFLSKNDLGRDYVVPPLEGLWWAEDMSLFTTNRDKSSWSWTMMLLTPDWIESQHVKDAIERAAKKKNQPQRLDDVRWESFSEGLVVQTLHIGSFDDEAPVLNHMHDSVIPDAGYQLTGIHHEIYFSDPRKADPSKLRTILRQPVAPL